MGIALHTVRLADAGRQWAPIAIAPVSSLIDMARESQV